MASEVEYRVMFRAAGLAGTLTGLVKAAEERAETTVDIALFINDLEELKNAIKAYVGGNPKW